VWSHVRATSWPCQRNTVAGVAAEDFRPAVAAAVDATAMPTTTGQPTGSGRARHDDAVPRSRGAERATPPPSTAPPRISANTSPRTRRESRETREKITRRSSQATRCRLDRRHRDQPEPSFRAPQDFRTSTPGSGWHSAFATAFRTVGLDFGAAERAWPLTEHVGFEHHPWPRGSEYPVRADRSRTGFAMYGL
jgi:hypothetical protein